MAKMCTLTPNIERLIGHNFTPFWITYPPYSLLHLLFFSPTTPLHSTHLLLSFLWPPTLHSWTCCETSAKLYRARASAPRVDGQCGRKRRGFFVGALIWRYERNRHQMSCNKAPGAFFHSRPSDFVTLYPLAAYLEG